MNCELNEFNFEFLDSRPQIFNSKYSTIFGFQIVHELFFMFILLKMAT
jgi:hypothetical protein